MQCANDHFFVCPQLWSLHCGPDEKGEKTKESVAIN